MEETSGKRRGLPYGTSLAMAVAAGVLAVLLWASPPARADTTFTVTSAADTDGNGCGSGCTLRQAINAANSAQGRNTIVFDLGPSATISLGGGLPVVGDAEGLTIDGGDAKITVSGGGKWGVFIVNRNAELTLQNLIVSDGSGNLGGGLSYGGALNNDGTLTVSDSTFKNNSAGTRSGSQAVGGGINNISGTLEVSDSTFNSNTAADGGGGIASSGPLRVSGSTFLYNGTGGGTGDGGAINGTGPLEVSNSTFFKNDALRGGGGAIASFSTLELTYSTFSGNRGGSPPSSSPGANDIANKSAEAATVGGTILGSVGLNCAGKISDGGYNIDRSTSCGFTASNSKSQTDPGLDPNGLRDNGGPTQTIALQGGSPAIDRIQESVNGCGTDVETDQRGVGRPQGIGCDIGAFELASGLGGTEGCTIRGTAGPDALIGTRGDDVICGRGGNDSLIGRGGDDALLGGRGQDVLLGTDGTRRNDALNGGRGRDVCLGDQGDKRASCEVDS